MLADAECSKELVTIVIPAYNGEGLIEESIISVLNQTYKPIELIVVDDKSKDRTVEKARKYHDDNSLFAFRTIVHKENVGLAATLNHGLRESHGQYFAILHQDCAFFDRNWIANALEYLQKNGEVAVITGYYGIPPEKLSFVTKAFGILRRQYHAASQRVSDEEVTFSEGKCDVFRKEVLEKIGGFPERFRIAGEDIYISYKIRQMNYAIVKSYRLPVKQSFGPSADSFIKNIRKEFLFGKAMGGIFAIFRNFVLAGLGTSEYSKRRSVQRATQPLFVFFFVLLLLLFGATQNSIPLGLGLFLLIGRYFFYVASALNEMLRMSSVFGKTATYSSLEALVIAALGVTVDFVYTFGFCYGLVLYAKGAEL